MKKWFLLGGMMAMSFLTRAQGPHKVLLDVTSKDTALHAAVIRHANGLAKAYPDMEVEVVIYGPAIAMVRSVTSPHAKKIEEMTANPMISVKVCAATMKRNKLAREDLVGGVDVVPDAIMEIVSKQREGWGYIKEN